MIIQMEVGKRIKMAKKKDYQRKVKMAKKNRRTKWAPFWTVLKKYGMGKRVHPSQMTRTRRNWRRTKLKIKPRKMRKSHFG